MEENKQTQNPDVIVDTQEENSTEIKENTTLNQETLASEEAENDAQENMKESNDEKAKEEEVIDYSTYSKEELLEETKKIAEEEYSAQQKNKMGRIKVLLEKQFSDEKREQFEAYIKNGNEAKDYKEEISEAEKEYRVAFSLYKKKRNAYIKNLDQLKNENLEKKRNIFLELQKLIDSEEPLKETYDKFKELQQEWKDVGLVPRNEVQNLWNQYNYLVEKFLEKVKIYHELKDLDLKKNLEQKIELCEKVEELLLESSIVKSFKALQEYHKQWKAIGPVPADKNDEIWDRFKAATDKINERRKEFYNKRQEEQENNYQAKLALCEKAENVLAKVPETNKDWADYSKEMSELLKVWKTYGPAPKEHNDDVWERFKSALDSFFEGKKTHFDSFKDEQKENLKKKLNICIQAESMQESTNWNQTTKDLISLQKDWKTIGPVPKSQSDKVWKRFRAACDHFFSAKEKYFENITEHEEDNLKKKEQLIEKIKKHSFSEEKDPALQDLKSFQREWSEIGQVPQKNKSEIQTAYRKCIDGIMEGMDISNYERKTFKYKTKYSNIIEENDQQNIQKEISKLNTRVGKLENDINVWENNIGFLSNSKNASQFKEDFEQKIAKAKKELDVLKEELKFLKQQKRK